MILYTRHLTEPGRGEEEDEEEKAQDAKHRKLWILMGVRSRESDPFGRKFLCFLSGKRLVPEELRSPPWRTAIRKCWSESGMILEQEKLWELLKGRPLRCLPWHDLVGQKHPHQNYPRCRRTGVEIPHDCGFDRKPMQRHWIMKDLGAATRYFYMKNAKLYLYLASIDPSPRVEEEGSGEWPLGKPEEILERYADAKSLRAIAEAQVGELGIDLAALSLDQDSLEPGSDANESPPQHQQQREQQQEQQGRQRETSEFSLSREGRAGDDQDQIAEIVWAEVSSLLNHWELLPRGERTLQALKQDLGFDPFSVNVRRNPSARAQEEQNSDPGAPPLRFSYPVWMMSPDLEHLLKSMLSPLERSRLVHRTQQALSEGLTPHLRRRQK